MNLSEEWLFILRRILRQNTSEVCSATLKNKILFATDTPVLDFWWSLP